MYPASKLNFPESDFKFLSKITEFTIIAPDYDEFIGDLIDGLKIYKNASQDDKKHIQSTIKRYIALSHMLGLKHQKKLINIMKKEIGKEEMEKILSEMQAAEYVAKMIRKHICALHQFAKVKKDNDSNLDNKLGEIIAMSDAFISNCLLDEPLDTDKIKTSLQTFISKYKNLELQQNFEYNMGISETLYTGLFTGFVSAMFLWWAGFVIATILTFFILPEALPIIIIAVAASAFVLVTSASIGFDCYKYSKGLTFWSEPEGAINKMVDKVTNQPETDNNIRNAFDRLEGSEELLYAFAETTPSTSPYHDSEGNLLPKPKFS